MASNQPRNLALQWMRSIRDAPCPSEERSDGQLEALPSTTKLVLLTLATRMDPDGSNCFPGIRQIAQDTSLNKDTVTKHLEAAEKKGWIERRTGAKGGQAWRRTLYVPRFPEGVRGEHTPSAKGVRANGTPPRERCPSSPEKLSEEPVHTSTGTSPTTDGGSSEGDGGSAPPPSWPSPSDLPSENGTGHLAYPEPFKSIWEAYPRQRGKKAAYRRVRALLRDGADLDQLLQAAASYHRRMDREGRPSSKIKLASTFFGPDDWWREELEIDDIESGGDGPDYRRLR